LARLTVCALVVSACGGGCPQVGALDHARAKDATHVEVFFRCDPDDVEARSFSIGDYRVAPPLVVEVRGANADGSKVVLVTAAQRAAVEYTLRYGADSTNFVGVGDATRAPITFRVDDSYNQSLKAVRVLSTFDPQTGFFSHYENSIDLADMGGHLFSATVAVVVDPLRTLDTSDDRLGPEHVAYAVRAIDPQSGGPLSKLIAFEVKTPEARTVDLPLSTVPPPPAPEGLVGVSFDIDDSPARALTMPALKGSIDSGGAFDPSFSTVVPLAAAAGHHFSGQTRVRIDPMRVRGGNTSTTYPYTFYLSNAGSDYPNLAIVIVAPDESPQMGSLRVGNAMLVPVTFRVDIARAYLTLDGSLRGKFAGESIFLTGQWAVAEDAFGRNASDAFSGGENLVLEMSERADHPGVWTRTLFLPPNRPYGWKVVRCPAAMGCAQLNRHVVSSGRAFATVLKNLATQNLDASTHPESTLVDPRAPGAYGAASVYHGLGMGLEPNPPGVPNPQTLFKQEAPDLVVTVATDPVTTPVYVIGSWRDVNLPQRPPDIIASGGVFDLGPWDYDAGFVGRAPLTYDLPTGDPGPQLQPTDGVLDASATMVAAGLWVARSGSTLYVATEPPGGGKDRFLVVSPLAPGASHPALWAKAGTLPFSSAAVFLAGEADSTYAGWFHYGAGAPDAGFTSPLGRGAVLEGTVDLSLLGMPAHVWLCSLGYASPDGGALDPATQHPPGNGDGNVDATEVIDVDLATL